MNADLNLFELLIEGLLKTGLILVLGLSGAWAFRRSTPEFRHRLWMPLFMIVLMAPVLLLLPRWEVLPTLSQVAEMPLESLTVLESPETTTDLIRVPIGAESVQELGGRFDWRIAILIVWSVGAVFLILRMTLGCLRVASWRRGAGADLVSRFVSDRTEQLRRELGISREVNVILSEKVRSPFAWGWRHPMVALPLEAIDWSEADLEMILRHELTHLVRRDTISVSLAGLVTALNWPNPLAWLAAKRVTELREQICDREVLSSGCDSERYATLLFSQARRRAAAFPISATAVARPGTLEKRIAMILKPTPNAHSASNDPDTARSRHFILGGFMAVAVAIVCLGLARPLLAQEAGNQRLIIHSYHDEKTGEVNRLGFEMNGEEFGFDQLEARLRPLAKQKGVLALAPAAILPMDELKRVIAVAEEAGIRYLTFEKRAADPSGEHGEAAGDPSSKQIHITTRFVEVVGDKEPSPLEKKLRAIVVPSVEFVNTPLKDALHFLQFRAGELDQASADPGKKGVNIILKGDDAFEKTPISLKLSNVPLSQALLYTASLAGGEMRVDENAVMIQPKSGSGTDSASLGEDPKASDETERKLKTIIIPMIEFVETPLPDALDFLRARSEQLDKDTADPDMKGINIVLSMNPDQVAAPPRISLNLKNVTLGDALRYSSDLANLNHRVQGNAVVIEAKPAK